MCNSTLVGSCTYPFDLASTFNKIHVTLTTCSLLFRAMEDAVEFMAKNEGLPIRQQVKAYLASCGDGDSQGTEAQSGAGSSFRASPPAFNPSGSKYLLRSLIFLC